MTSMKPLGRVMLIDDEKFDHKMYRRTLERADAADDILSFYYAEEALVYLMDEASPSIDLIFLDVRMPRMNGFEFLNALQEKTGGNVDPVIVLMLTTTLTQADSLRAANSPLIRDCFNKPLSASSLEIAAHYVMDRRLSRNLMGNGRSDFISPYKLTGTALLT